jgi:hypothetical protein
MSLGQINRLFEKSLAWVTTKPFLRLTKSLLGKADLVCFPRMFVGTGQFSILNVNVFQLRKFVSFVRGVSGLPKLAEASSNRICLLEKSLDDEP